MAKKRATEKEAVIKKPRKPNARVDIDDDFLAQVEAMAAVGCTQEQIAKNLGLSAETLSRKKQTNEQLCQALKRGQAKGIEQVASALFAEATKHRSVVAMIFYLCNRDKENWKHVSKAGEGANAESDQKLVALLTNVFARFPN